MGNHADRVSGAAMMREWGSALSDKTSGQLNPCPCALRRAVRQGIVFRTPETLVPTGRILRAA